MISSAQEQFLKTLSNPKRVELMLLLLKKPMNVTELAKKSSLEQSVVSHHLKRLKICSFVDVVPNGKERMYTINEKTVGPLFRLMDKHINTYCKKLCCS